MHEKVKIIFCFVFLGSEIINFWNGWNEGFLTVPQNRSSRRPKTVFSAPCQCCRPESVSDHDSDTFCQWRQPETVLLCHHPEASVRFVPSPGNSGTDCFSRPSRQLLDSRPRGFWRHHYINVLVFFKYSLTSSIQCL